LAECARFKGTTELTVLDMKPMEADIIGQVGGAMTLIQRNTSMAVTLEGELERNERWEYPLEAVREPVMNALCHRDYADSANGVLKIFDDRLEVWNPGGLPPGLSIEDLKRPHESKPRNKLIARCFFLIKYIEQFGTGTGRMLQDCRDAGVPEPEFESSADSFRIVFRRAVSPREVLSELNLSSRRTDALEYAITHPKLTRPDYERIALVPRATANRDLTELVKRGFLQKKGAARRTWYEFTFSGNEKIREKIISTKMAGKPGASGTA
jgi:ATP-dependent DNA helicase RecG